jgi:hypothetical protein
MEYPFNLLTPDFIATRNLTSEIEYEVKEICARELLVPQRIDLMAKWIYIDARVRGINYDFAREIYEKHLEAFSYGTFVEPGNPNKNSLQKYLDTFDVLIEDFKENGFNDTKSLIPIGAGNDLLDGAHRCSCAAYFNQKVKVVYFPNLKTKFDYQYFSEHRLSDEILDIMVTQYCELNNQVYVACLWPRSGDLEKRKKAIELISSQASIIYERDITLEYQGLRNFMLQIYGSQDWIGVPENHYVGVKGKVDSCYWPGKSTYIVVFQGIELSSVLKLKDKIRDIFGIGKHAIHISDNDWESRQMCKLLLNDNSRHHLNYGNPDRYLSTIEKLERVSSGGILNPESSLAVYGLLESPKIAVTSEKEINHRQCFYYNGKQLYALTYLIQKGMLPEDSLDVVKQLLKNTNYDNVDKKRQQQYLSIQRKWKREQSVLKFKQFMAKIASSFGMYELLHRMHHRGGKQV